ncbi:MAG: ACT domain-containing protein [Faecalibacterium sp.]|jgi:hypothetical protein|nr:ACT domain-containing protein [Faecalibacterium sp.]
MKLEVLTPLFSVCKVAGPGHIPWTAPFCFVGKTDEELSLVCPTADAPNETLAREDGWRALRVKGPLDFSLVGILAQLSATLAAANVGIFAVSTYDTDYILTRSADFAQALCALRAAGHEITD